MRLARTVAICATLSVMVGTAARSADFRDVVQGLATQYVRGWDDLDARRADLATQIDAAVKSGQLTPTQAKDFRDSLTQLAQNEAQDKASGRRMSIVQSMQYSNQLSSLANALQQAMSQTVSSLPDVDALRAQLSTRVDQAVTAGRINATTATSLRAELQHVADIESAYKAETGGALSPRQVELLSDELTKAKADVEQQITISDSAAPALNDKRVAIETKIDTAVTAGKLQPADAAAIKKELTRIAAEQATYTSAGAILTGSQVLHIAQELDAADDMLTAKMIAQVPPVAVTPPTGLPAGAPPQSGWREGNMPQGGWREGTMPQGGWHQGGMPPAATPPAAVQMPPQSGRGSVEELDAFMQATNGKLRDAVRSGLSAEQAARFTHNLDELRMQESQYQSGIAGITADEVDELRGKLRQLNRRLDDAMANAAQLPSTADQTPPPTADEMPPVAGGGLPVNIGGATSVGNFPIVNTRPLADIRGFWGEQYVSELSSRGVIGGFPDGSFKPNDEITRAQFAAIVARALNLAPMPQAANFTDVAQKYWAAGVIGSAVNAGLITGYPDGTYKPEDKITRAQALVILSKALRGVRLNPNALSAYSDANAVPGWAQRNLTMAASAGIIVSFPDPAQIRPNENATRGDVAALMYQTLNALGANLPPLRIGVLALR